MKSNLTKVLGMVAALLACLPLLPVPASAATQQWSAEPVPSRTDFALGPGGVDVRDMAVAADGTTVYVAPGDSLSGNTVYKSTNAGMSWTALAAPMKSDFVALAPDDAAIVGIAGQNTPAVYISTDGGSTWSSLGTPQESGRTAAAAIYDIAISAASTGIHYVAVAGSAGGGGADIWYFNLGSAAPVWKSTGALAGFSGANMIKAIAFSPGFSSDSTLAALSIKDNVSVTFDLLNLASNQWNASAGFTGYPVTVATGSGITGLTSASISLSPKYLASNADTRLAFLGLTVSGDAAAAATSGLYRLQDTNVSRLQTGASIHSVSFDGFNLVAGAYDSTAVYNSTDSLATMPTVNVAPALKRPGGENKVVVAWAGGKVVAGTSGNESAFAISRNQGKDFNDISLIDTAMTNVRDVAVSADGSKVYLATDDGSDLSLWRKTSSWERVLSQQSTVNYIVRTAPEDANAVYVAKKNGATVYYTSDGGETGWLARTCGINVHDLAIGSADIAYALSSDGKVAKTSDAGFTWLDTKATGLNSGAMITSASPNTLLVGSQDGFVAYSTDGSGSWTKISRVLERNAGNIQVVADTAFATNKTIYAASDTVRQNIKKWVIGTSSDWSDIFNATLSGGVYGLAMGGRTLYALEFSPYTNQSTLWLCLAPATATSTSSSWSAKSTSTTTDANDTTVHLNATPQALRASSINNLWAVKTNGTKKLYRFTALLTGLTLGTPKVGFVNPVNAITGVANDMVFNWSRLSPATEYELDIALDNAFNELIATVTVPSELSTVVVTVGPNQTGTARVNFIPGTSYYWRVRVTQPLYSLYSEVRKFSIASLTALTLDLLTPANGGTGISRTPSFSWSPVAGVTEYRFVLADNFKLASPLVDITLGSTAFAMSQELDHGKTYYWSVKAITPSESGGSVLANFTVEAKPAEPLPPVIVKQAPPPVIQLPPPPPPATTIVTSPPPPPPPAPVTPDYVRTAAIVGTVLLAGVLTLIARTFRKARVRVAEVKPQEEAQPVSFAAETFLWMLTAAEKDNRILSAEEEHALGQIIAAKIRNLARAQLIYRTSPKEADVLLNLWSRYGSRDETSQYLTRSFRQDKNNVIEFLKCYLPVHEGGENDILRAGAFSRIQYDSVAKVVAPDNVLDALKRLYGPELDMLAERGVSDSLDKAIAYQFTRIHRSVKSKTAAGAKAGDYAR